VTEKPIWLKFNKEGLRIHTPNYKLIGTTTNVLGHGLLIDDYSITFERRINSSNTTAKATFAYFLIKDSKWIISEGTYLGDDTSKSLATRLSDLGFKGPYDIKYGSA
jgi:hypothetical protein